MTVAIYVSTMRSDYHLAKALVASIEAHVRSPRIYLIPDDDYRGDEMFGHPVWRPTDPRILELDRYYKKLRVFWGPAERFMHMDADQLVLRDLQPYLDHIAAAEGPFVMANRRSSTWKKLEAADESARKRELDAMTGDTVALALFDPAFDWRDAHLLNSGEFSASRDAIDRDTLLDVFARAKRFYGEQGLGAMTGSRLGPFMGDQGFLSYFLAAHAPGTRVEWLDDLYAWGGRDELIRYRDDDPTDPLKWVAIHWAGCPRPGPIPLPGRAVCAADWRRHHRRACRHRGDWPGYVEDLLRDAGGLAWQVASRVKRRLTG
ncbi:MAG: hypothetical protein WCH79_15225 [Planctomycetia bacterium]